MGGVERPSVGTWVPREELAGVTHCTVLYQAALFSFSFFLPLFLRLFPFSLDFLHASNQYVQFSVIGRMSISLVQPKPGCV